MQYTPAELPGAEDASTGVGSVLTQRRKLLFVAAVLIAAFGYFGYTAFQSATSFYFTVDELVERGPVSSERSVQVKGTLEPFTFERAGTATMLATFRLEENGARIDAIYDGVLPDLFFNPHSELVLSGTYGEDGVFVTERLLIKCPSKYEALDVENPYDDVPVAG